MDISIEPQLNFPRIWLIPSQTRMVALMVAKIWPEMLQLTTLSVHESDLAK